MLIPKYYLKAKWVGFGFILVLLGSGACKSPKLLQPTLSRGSTYTEGELLQLASGNHVLYAFEDAKTMDNFVKEHNEGKMQLGWAKMDVGEFMPDYQPRSIGVEGYIKNFEDDRASLRPKLKTDDFGSYGKYFVDGPGELDLFKDLSVLKKTDTFAVYHKGGLLSPSYVEVRRIDEVDARVTGLKYGEAANKNLGDLVKELRSESIADLKANKKVSVELSKGLDPQLVVARLQTEFGARFAYDIAKDQKSVVISPLLRLESALYRPSQGPALQVKVAVLSDVQKALTDPNLLPAGGRLLVVTKKDGLDVATLRETGLYKNADNVEAANLIEGGVKAEVVGRDASVYFIERKPAALETSKPSAASSTAEGASDSSTSTPRSPGTP